MTVCFRSVRRNALIIPLLWGTLFLHAQEQQIDQLAAAVGAKLQTARQKRRSPKVIVIDFGLRPGRLDALGVLLADNLSDALAKNAAGVQVVPRQELCNYLRANLLSPSDLQDKDIAAWSALQVGASSMVTGFVTTGDNTITLSVELIRPSDGKQFGDVRATLPMTDAFRELLNKPPEWPASPSPDVIVPCSAGEPEQTVAEFKAAGVSLLKCVYCPDPEYTPEARRHKAQGSVRLNVVVDADGRAVGIYPVKGAPYGFVENSVNALRTWQFTPAMKEGKPVKVCVTVETTFSIY